MSWVGEGAAVGAALASILGHSYLSHRLLRLPAGFAFAFAMGSLLLLLYAALLLGRLAGASHLLYWAGLLAGGGCLLLDAHARRQHLSFFRTPALLWSVGTTTAIWPFLRGQTFRYWDEFTHWGYVARELIRTNDAWENPPSSLACQDYPPGAALFQYFVATNSFLREDVVILAHDWLVLIPLAVTLGAAVLGQWQRMGLVVFGVLYFLHTLGLGLDTVRIDHALSAWFATAIVGHFALAASARSSLFLLPVLGCLPLLKESGVFFAGIVVAVVAVDFALRARSDRGRGAPLVVLGLLAASLLPRASWQNVVEHRGLKICFPKQPLSLRETIEDLGPKASATAAALRTNFLQQVAAGGISEIRPGQMLWDRLTVSDPAWRRMRTLSTLEWTALLFALLVASAVSRPAPDRRRLLALGLVLAAGFYLYLVGLLVTYLRLFGPWLSLQEVAEQLPSLARYTRTYLCALGIVAFAALTLNLIPASRLGRNRTLIGAILATAAILFQTPDPKLVFPKYTDPRIPHREPLDRLLSVAASRSTIAIVLQVEDPGEPLALFYALEPRTIRWFFPTTQPDSQPRRLELSPRDFVEGVGASDYLFIARANRRFWREYASVLPATAPPDSEGAVFRVAGERDGRLVLLPVAAGTDSRAPGEFSADGPIAPRP